MRASQISPGDTVEVNRGGTFKAEVTGPERDGRFPIRPLLPCIGYLSATAKQIKRVLSSSAQQRLLGGDL
jgi:hypothetical protein